MQTHTTPKSAPTAASWQQKQQETLELLVDTTEKLGTTVRFENLHKAHLKIDSGFCVLKEQSTIFVDKKLKPKEKIEILKNFIKTLDIDSVHLTPQMREIIEKP